MIVKTEFADVAVDGTTMRMFVATPRRSGKFPGILFYSDIFQLTGPMLRACVRLAGYGFVVAAPEIYHRIEQPGTVIAFDDAGRTQGLENAMKTSVLEFDRDARAVLDYLATHPACSSGLLGVAGFCIGGHLAFRAAFNPDARSTVCFYPTGIHSGKLGKEEDAGSLERGSDIRGQLLLIFGRQDPHIPEDGRKKIVQSLEQASVGFRVVEYDAEHAFMRDEGPRYDPEATDLAWNEAIQFFRSTMLS